MKTRFIAAIQTFFMIMLCWVFSLIGDINVFWLLTTVIVYQANLIMNALDIGEFHGRKK